MTDGLEGGSYVFDLTPWDMENLGGNNFPIVIYRKMDYNYIIRYNYNIHYNDLINDKPHVFIYDKNYDIMYFINNNKIYINIL